MPIGRYAILDDDGSRRGTEEFRCEPGPMGWRSFSNIRIETGGPHDEIVDLAVDSSWRPGRTRVWAGGAVLHRIETGAHIILPSAEGDPLGGFHDREPISIPWSSETEIDYASP